LQGCKILDMEWRVGGTNSIGMLLPLDTDFSGFSRAWNNHHIVAILLYQIFRQHKIWPSINRVIDFIYAQNYRINEPGRLKCYEGLLTFILDEVPEVYEAILEEVGRYPDLKVKERLELTDLILRAKNLDEMEALRETEYYSIFRGEVNLLISAAQNTGSLIGRAA